MQLDFIFAGQGEKLLYSRRAVLNRLFDNVYTLRDVLAVATMLSEERSAGFDDV